MKLLLTLAALAVCTNALATEYVYRDLMANTLPSFCSTETESAKMATTSYRVFKIS